LGSELRDWLLAALLAVPVLGIFVLLQRSLPGPVFVLLLLILGLGPLFAIAVFSRTSIWWTLIWLGPITAAYFACLFLDRPLHPAVILATFLAVIWATGIAFFPSFSDRVLRPFHRLLAWLTAISLPASGRQAYRQYRAAHSRTPAEKADAHQLDDLARTAAVFQATANRIGRIDAPDDRWADVFRVSVDMFAGYAEMLDGRRQMDIEEVKAISERREALLHALLRQDSWLYRILSATVLEPEPPRPSST